MAEAFSFHASLEKPVVFADFDSKAVKKGMQRVGKDVTQIARKLISRKTISKAFEMPGKRTGALQASVSAKTSKSGFSAIIASRDTAGFRKRTDGDFFYPYALVFGHVGPGGMLKRDGKRVHRKNSGKKVAQPRANFVVEAASIYGQARYQDEIAKVLESAIKPGPVEELLK